MSDHKEERVLHEGWQVCGRQGGTAAMCGSCGDGQFGGEAAVVLEGKRSLFARRGFNIRVSLRAIPRTCAPRGVLKRWLWVSSSGPHAFLRKCCAHTHSPPSAVLANSESHLPDGALSRGKACFLSSAAFHKTEVPRGQGLVPERLGPLSNCPVDKYPLSIPDL